jgi:hypothetical protein
MLRSIESGISNLGGGDELRIVHVNTEPDGPFLSIKQNILLLNISIPFRILQTLTNPRRHHNHNKLRGPRNVAANDNH